MTLNNVFWNYKFEITNLKLKSRDQLKTRTQNIWNCMLEDASNSDREPSQLWGLLLTRCKEKSVREIGQSLWKKTKEDKKLPVETALVIYNDSNLGRST